MSEATCWVGLDVHASRTAVAVIDTATGEIAKRTVLGRPHEAFELLEQLPGPVRAVYEAGPTGYGLARRSRPGLEIEVCAPGDIAVARPAYCFTGKASRLIARMKCASVSCGSPAPAGILPPRVIEMSSA